MFVKLVLLSGFFSRNQTGGLLIWRITHEFDLSKYLKKKKKQFGDNCNHYLESLTDLIVFKLCFYGINKVIDGIVSYFIGRSWMLRCFIYSIFYMHFIWT